MRRITTTATALFLFVSANAALADCSKPDMPTLPDGASASMEEMVAGQKAVKAFMADSGAYLECLDKKAADFKAPADETEEAKAARETAHVNTYNTAVDEQEKIANGFNAAIKAFKARSK
jgi:hypothetical protein